MRPAVAPFLRGREGELLACLGPEERPQTLIQGLRRDLMVEEVAWLGAWVQQGEVQHLEHSYGFRCGMEPDEGIKLFDVCREGVVQTVMGLEWEIWDSRKHSAARVAVECSTTDVLSEVEVAWLMEKLEEQESRRHVREQQEVEVGT